MLSHTQCQESGAKVETCSHEQCTNNVVKGGVWKYESLFNVLSYALINTKFNKIKIVFLSAVRDRHKHYFCSLWPHLIVVSSLLYFFVFSLLWHLLTSNTLPHCFIPSRSWLLCTSFCGLAFDFGCHFCSFRPHVIAVSPSLHFCFFSSLALIIYWQFSPISLFHHTDDFFA